MGDRQVCLCRPTCVAILGHRQRIRHHHIVEVALAIESDPSDFGSLDGSDCIDPDNPDIQPHQDLNDTGMEYSHTNDENSHHSISDCETDHSESLDQEYSRPPTQSDIEDDEGAWNLMRSQMKI
jgi:hypothetical protein